MFVYNNISSTHLYGVQSANASAEEMPAGDRPAVPLALLPFSYSSLDQLELSEASGRPYHHVAMLLSPGYTPIIHILIYLYMYINNTELLKGDQEHAR